MENLMEKYRESAIALAKKYNYITVSEHIIQVMVSVMMHRDEEINGGTFAEAVCNDCLSDVINYGDEECLQNIKLIYLAKRYGYHYV